MTTQNKIKTVLILAAVAMAIGIISSPTQAGPLLSIDFGEIQQSGEPTNADGLQIPGQEGDWPQLPISNGENSITVNSVTFTINPGGTEELGGWPNGGLDPLRRDYYCIIRPARYTGPVTWELTGLDPQSTYDIILFSNSATQQGYFSIPGFDAGNGPGNNVTNDSEGDGNFIGVPPDGTGKISGIFDVVSDPNDVWATFAGIQVAHVPPDSDGDGMSDEFELLYTDPPSPVDLDPDDDLEPDGLTNLQEYNLQTEPNNVDTDGDTLIDGDEVAGAGLRPATNPAKADTDGDGLSDGVETNTMTFVSSSDTGTDPTNPDTDGDALSDGVETNTGTFVSDTDTGTDPFAVDTDTDGAEDWYEVAASYTDPTSSSDSPVIPYPLPAPDASTGAADKPVKVYIMAGQSNMDPFHFHPGSNRPTACRMARAVGMFVTT